MPTRRLLILLLLAAPFGAAGSPLVLVGVAIASLALLAALVDWLLAGDGRRIEVRRLLASDKLSLGAWNLITLEIHNTTSRPQRLTIREVPPLSFLIDLKQPIFTTYVAAHAGETLTYHARPPRRGDATFGDLYVRVAGPLGRVRRNFRHRNTAQPVRVYPNLRELRRYDLMVRRGLEAQPV